MDRGRSWSRAHNNTRNNMSHGDANSMLRLLEDQLAGKIEAIVQRQTSNALERMMPAMGPGMNQRPGPMVEPFDPDDRTANVEMWLAVIDQLGEIRGWADHERVNFMKGNLRGRARAWSNRFETFGLSWPEWKEMLRKTFQVRHNFGASLEELAARRKLPTENMSHYFYKKLELCERCDITGEKAVSCIIWGLPEELREDAYACNCYTPEALLSVYLSGLENYQSVDMMDSFVNPFGGWEGQSHSEPAIDGWEDESRSGPAPYTSGQTDKFKKRQCFNCNEYGHAKSQCPYWEPQSWCNNCSRPGHRKANCPKRGEVKRKGAPVTNVENPKRRRFEPSDDYEPVDSQIEKTSPAKKKQGPTPRCRICMKLGHVTRVCFTMPCKVCRKRGHRETQCPTSRRRLLGKKPNVPPGGANVQSTSAAGSVERLTNNTIRPKRALEDIQCGYCLDYGHRRRCCPELPCVVCGKQGHRSKQCPQLETIAIPTKRKGKQPVKKSSAGGSSASEVTHKEGKSVKGEAPILEEKGKERDEPETSRAPTSEMEHKEGVPEMKHPEASQRNCPGGEGKGNDCSEDKAHTSEVGGSEKTYLEGRAPGDYCPDGGAPAPEMAHKAGESGKKFPEGIAPTPEVCSEGAGPSLKEGETAKNDNATDKRETVTSG